MNTNPNIHNLDLIRNYINVIYNILDIKYIECIDYTNENNGSNINDIVSIYKSYLYASLESNQNIGTNLISNHKIKSIIECEIEIDSKLKEKYMESKSVQFYVCFHRLISKIFI